MDITLRQGETLEFDVTIDDLTAETVQLLVNNAGGNVINETASFATVDGKWVASIRTDDTNLPVSGGDVEYHYMLVVEYSDGVIEKLPDSTCEDDDCELPLFIVCEALTEGVS